MSVFLEAGGRWEDVGWQGCASRDGIRKVSWCLEESVFEVIVEQKEC